MFFCARSTIVYLVPIPSHFNAATAAALVVPSSGMVNGRAWEKIPLSHSVAFEERFCLLDVEERILLMLFRSTLNIDFQIIVDIESCAAFIAWDRREPHI